MKDRIGVTAVAAAALTGALLATPLVASPAYAEDQRPCVSKVEYLSMKWVTRKQTEARWEVTGLGHMHHYSWLPHWVFYQYPVCGYDYSERFVSISVRRSNHQVIAAVIFRYVGGTLHGHKRYVQVLPARTTAQAPISTT